MAIQLGILIFDEVEVLDFCGPLEVFGAANDVSDPQPFDLFIIAEEKEIVHARKNLDVMPTHSIEDCPALDILVIPGGVGTRALLDNSELQDWIRKVYPNLQYLLTVCTGSILLGKTGLLDGHKATTHHTCFRELEMVSPATEIIRDQRFVESGNFVTSAGISAGIDMSLFMVEKLLGKNIAEKVIQEMEYTTYPDPKS